MAGRTALLPKAHLPLLRCPRLMGGLEEGTTALSDMPQHTRPVDPSTFMAGHEIDLASQWRTVTHPLHDAPLIANISCSSKKRGRSENAADPRLATHEPSRAFVFAHPGSAAVSKIGKMFSPQHVNHPRFRRRSKSRDKPRPATYEHSTVSAAPCAHQKSAVASAPVTGVDLQCLSHKRYRRRSKSPDAFRPAAHEATNEDTTVQKAATVPGLQHYSRQQRRCYSKSPDPRPEACEPPKVRGAPSKARMLAQTSPLASHHSKSASPPAGDQLCVPTETILSDMAKADRARTWTQFLEAGLWVGTNTPAIRRQKSLSPSCAGLLRDISGCSNTDAAVETSLRGSHRRKTASLSPDRLLRETLRSCPNFVTITTPSEIAAGHARASLFPQKVPATEEVRPHLSHHPKPRSPSSDGLSWSIVGLPSAATSRMLNVAASEWTWALPL